MPEETPEPMPPTVAENLAAQTSQPGGVRTATEHAPERLGRYRNVAQLGAGGFGVVYKAWDESLSPLEGSGSAMTAKLRRTSSRGYIARVSRQCTRTASPANH